MLACSPSAWSASPPVLALLAGSLVSLFVALWVGTRRDLSGRGLFVCLHVAILWWTSAAALELMVAGTGCKVFWAAMAWPGIVATPTLWAIFLLTYIHHGQYALQRWQICVVTLVPVLVWALALHNDEHGWLYRAGTAPISADPHAPVRYIHGPLFYAVAVYVYVFMSISVYTAWRSWRASPGLYRRHYLGFLLITLLPWIANSAYVVGGWTLFGFDPTPFCFLLTALGFTWLIGRRRLFDLSPIAQHVLLEQLPDPVLVTDLTGRVTQINQAARQLAGDADGLIGEPLSAWPRVGTELAALSKTGDTGHIIEFTDPAGCYEIQQVDLQQHGHTLGRLLLLRDVTARVMSERKLSAALLALEAQLETTARLQDELREQAIRDPLTGLYNRRYLETLFPREQARAKREGNPLSVVMIDLDHFKRLNDDYGHLAGDQVLREVAAQLRAGVRESDLAFRFGGEEMLLLLPGVDKLAAFERADRLRTAMAATVMETEWGRLSVTFSAGVATAPSDGDDLDALIGKADHALYAAKHAGRNQVRMA
ncbi:diguanylate cyclase [Chitinimonas sp. BJYL2]|uniref:histidine kinase N-terminal 7TM domain-containing diguanylate cyclase n=1 Tax=Chitinimonas sp. BJYL2 TaxID=2976696 RepID=UPI0022B4E5A7|nr:diguanylate cyclase [Chitinimonas sp. BJYL2]